MNRFKLLAGLCLQGIFLAAPAYAAPTITPTLSGTAGTNGWYVSDVTVTWSVVDPDFPILSTLGCDPVTVDFDTGGTFVSCQATSAGGISTQTVRVQRDVTPPELSLFIPADGASYTIDSGVNTEWTSRDLTSGAMPVQLTDGPFDLSTLGVKTFGVSVSDRAGNVTQVTHSYTVIDLPDTTAPVITPAITGTLGNNGWYTSDVVISWSVVEEESTISASSGCDTATLSTDTVGTSYTCSATSEGGSASASVTILRDATAPVITLNSPLDASEFVLDSVVNADWSVADAQSGVASESGSTVSGAAIDTASLGGKVYGVSATDNAGNSTNLEHAYSVVPAPDTSAPMISATVNGTLGDNGWYTSDVSVSWNISDAESPITASTGCEAVTLVDDTAGVTLTCLATSDGGSASASVTILRDATAPVITLSSPADASEFELGSAVLADWSVSDATAGVAAASGSTESGIAIDTSVSGGFSYSVTAVDNAGNAASLSHSYTVFEPVPPIVWQLLSRPVIDGGDDVEQAPGMRSVKTGSDDLEIVADGDDEQTVGIRFRDIAIPQGALINRAWIQFTADKADDVPSLLNWRAEDSDDAPLFSGDNRSLIARLLTEESSAWVPDAWELVGSRGEAERSSDLADIVQALVTRSGWQSGNTMLFSVSGFGRRVAVAFDGRQDQAPELFIEYSPICPAGLPDSDADGYQDRCDIDDDNDGVADADDAFPLDPSESVDTDGDGIGNTLDTDDDGDGVGDSDDAFPLDRQRSFGYATEVVIGLSDDSDDAEEFAGRVELGSGDLDLGSEFGESSLVGLRFASVDVPAGAVITSSYLQFTAGEIGFLDSELTIRAEAAADSASFGATAGRRHRDRDGDQNAAVSLSSRPTTQAAVEWQPAPWLQVGESGDAQATTNFALLLQELVDQPDWQAGNAVALLIEGSGQRVAVSVDDSRIQAAKLVVRYFLP